LLTGPSIPENYTTHPQAEVLVFDHIGPEHIMGAAFNDSALKNQYIARFTGFQFVYIPGLFNGRQDYLHWKRNG
jgi:hypothetical protein